jgi:hypothetical protein
VKEVLINSREFIFQDFVEVVDYSLVALHAASPLFLVLGRPSYDFVAAKEKPLIEGLFGVSYNGLLGEGRLVNDRL